MTIHLHVLRGCSPTPLANYLKALGILRLVGEQADPDARGWWQDEAFCLLTKLSKAELEAFFLERYEPTPIFNPWGGRSGYYPESSEKTARNALSAIEAAGAGRLSKFQAAITLVRSVIRESGGRKPDSEKSRSEMISRIRSRIRGPGLDWLDTVLADLGGSFGKPPILGTGGNEGSGSYTAAFVAALVECLVNQSWNSVLASSLWSNGSEKSAWDGSFQPPTRAASKRPRKERVDEPFRQYLPGSTGSPWDLLLAFEGAVVVRSGVARRSSADRHRFLTSPFCFSAMGIGAGSSSETDEFVLNKGRKNRGRGEQWFPVWSTPSTYRGIETLFREGRCAVRRRSARTPLDAARAICTLGVSRGVNSFVRYGYLQRNNLATHFAVPLGRIQVRERPTARLVDDLLDWLDNIHRLARKEKPQAPARLKAVHRRLFEAVFAALTHDYTPQRLQAILLAATDVEALQASGTAIEAGPIPALRPEWVSAVDDGSPELRLALALGSAAGNFGGGRPIDPVRHHWLPLKRDKPRDFHIREKRLVNDPRVVMTGRDPLADLAAVVERRLIEATQSGQRRSGLMAAPACGAHLSDLAAFLSGLLDLAKVAGLARAFMALRWDQWRRDHAPPAPPAEQLPDEAWLAVRLCCLPWPLSEDKDIPADKRVVRLLSAGDAARAIECARQRLRAVGIRPPFVAAVTDPNTARRWAAALAFPIHRDVAQRIATILDPSFEKGGAYV